MKRNIIYLVGALLSSAILTFSCADDDVPSYSDLSVDKNDLFIKIENPTAEVNITNGNGNYKVTVADDNIASAQIDGNKIIVTGLKNGTTTATVMDWTKHSSVINIKVKEDFELKTDKEEITLFLDDEKLSTTLVNIVSGNGDYKVETSNEEVATAEMNDKGQILITAVSSDFCDVILTDADGNKATVKVGVCAEHLVIEDIMGKACIKDQTMDITITTGNGEYSVVSENPEIATAEMVDGVIRVTGVAKGETNITVTDRMKQTATVKVKVSGGFEIEVSHIDTVYIIGDYKREQSIPIIDGSGDYTIDAGSSIDCKLSDDKTKFIVKGIDKKMARNQTIKITDKVFNTDKTITVDWVDYDFWNDYGIARYYIEGKFAIVNASDLQDDSNNNRVRMRVGDGRTWVISGKGKVKNGYLVGFSNENGYEPGIKDPNNLVLAKITGTGADGAVIKITELEIVKRVIDPDRGENDGKYWIRFKEANRDEWSYMIAYP